VAHPPKELASGQRWPGLVQNDRLHECFTFCKNLSGINDFTLNLSVGVSLILGHGVEVWSLIQAGGRSN